MVREATVKDGPEILNLINTFANSGLMLPKTLYKIYTNIQNFFVVEHDGNIVGCAALNVMWEDACEICSLAVNLKSMGRGHGRILVEKCIERARKLGIKNVIALTYQDKFFEKMGFKLGERDSFPRKLWRECLECPKLEACDELAYVYVIEDL